MRILKATLIPRCLATSIALTFAHNQNSIHENLDDDTFLRLSESSIKFDDLLDHSLEMAKGNLKRFDKEAYKSNC